MAQEINFETQLADLLDTRNFHPETLGRDGRPSNTQDAKIFSFDYVSSSGRNYGTMVIVLTDNKEMMIMYGDNLGRAMEDDRDRDEFFEFQQQLMKLVDRQSGWRGTLMDISKLKRVQAGMAAIKEGLFEGYYGTSRVSYTGQPTEARLMIRHDRSIRENDARYRHIDSLFIETAEGERFRLPFTHLAAGKAMLEHVRQGGKPYDIRGNHITEIVTELKTLARFNRAAQNRVMEGVSSSLVEQAQQYYHTVRENLKKLASARGYQEYFESWHPAVISETEDVVENIKQLFIEQTIDTRIEAALPLLAKIQQQGTNMKEAEIFESWVSRMAEGTWNLPETPEQINKLKELMSRELIVGPDATNATEQLYHLVGDDILFDRLEALAERDPRANAWNDTEVMDRLRELGIEMPAQEPAAEPQSNEQTPPETDAQQPAADTVAQQPPMAEGTDMLEQMLRHAGVEIKENVLMDAAGETLRHIVDRFKHEVRRFSQGEELDSDLYDALYDYYSSRGDMPYGVAKARTGDPFQWVTGQFDKDMGGLGFRTMHEADPMHTFETDTEMEGKGACNMTAEGEYCPEHGLAECGYMESMGGTVAGAVAPVMQESEHGDTPISKMSNRELADYLDTTEDAVAKDREAAEERAHDKRRDMVDEGQDDPINYNAAITSSYYESQDPLLRIKELALKK